MILFWTTYLFFSLGLSFLFSLLVDNRILKIFIFSFSLALMCTVWFKNPGENIVVPIFAIFILETTILENNGFERIIRPLSLITFLLALITFFSWKKKSKN
tara:strand:- start:1467 stop:1769 length:303 start_codon:yes stop_codon:yes gene_type:complete